jgi:hypothetical protein
MVIFHQLRIWSIRMTTFHSKSLKFWWFGIFPKSIKKKKKQKIIKWLWNGCFSLFETASLQDTSSLRTFPDISSSKRWFWSLLWELSHSKWESCHEIHHAILLSEYYKPA